MEIQQLTPEYDVDVASLVRRNLKAYHLDIPGTVYFDDTLDHLSEYYDHPGRAYYVLLDDGKVIGSVGLAEFTGFDNCCELQKLYLDDTVKRQGLGNKLVDFIEDRGREMGYHRMYLETHHALQEAIHLYEKKGYREIERPQSVVHSTMDTFFLKEL